MRRHRNAVVVAAALAIPSIPQAAQISGQAVFDRYCGHCHADSREAPGTLQLARRLGADGAVLTERDDLVGAYVDAVVRNGLNAMPPFAPSDLDEAKLRALIEFLTR
jgi:mono/diheme cytochrome c family protein